MWRTVLITFLVLAISLVIWLQLTSPSRITQLDQETRATSSKQGRFWTTGTQNGIIGRYYLVAYGFTIETAGKLAQQLAAKNNKVLTPQELSVITATLARGNILSYFRKDGDVRPLASNLAEFLKPIGKVAEVTIDDTFMITNTTIQVPALDSDTVLVSRNGTLEFGGLTRGSPLQFQPVSNALSTPNTTDTPNNGMYITSQTPIGPVALQTGPFMCPYTGTAPSSFITRACSTIKEGGPRIPHMVSSVGDVYYFEEN